MVSIFYHKIARAVVVLAIFTVIFVFACRGGDEKTLFIKDSICNNLIREKFRIFSGGAYSAELYSDYITDSINFRKYVGEHDESSSLAYQCEGDSIVVLKFRHDEKGNKKLINREVYSMSELKRNRKFE